MVLVLGVAGTAAAWFGADTGARFYVVVVVIVAGAAIVWARSNDL